MTGNLQKDPSILQLLNRLRADLGDDAFDIVDHWEGESSAIGLALPSDHRVLVYVCTEDLPQGSFSYELELPPNDETSVYSVARRSDGCSYLELLGALSSHWKISKRL